MGDVKSTYRDGDWYDWTVSGYDSKTWIGDDFYGDDVSLVHDTDGDTDLPRHCATRHYDVSGSDHDGNHHIADVGFRNADDRATSGCNAADGQNAYADGHGFGQVS
jgi:hypothetical protein